MNLIREIDELSCDFCTPLEPQKVMDTLITRLVDRYGIAAAGIWRLNHGQSALSLAATAGGPQFPASLQEISASQSHLGRAAQAKASQVYPGSAANGDELALWADQNQFRFLSAFPLADESNTAGVLVLAAPETPDESTLALFRLHARLASIALRDAELFAGAQHNLERLQSMVEASKVFNSTLDLSELLAKILDVAKTLTKCRARNTIPG